MNTHQAKKIVREWLTSKGMDNKITARTIDFSDLARSSCVFVRIHEWKPSPLWDEIKQLTKSNGFCIET